MVKTPPPQSHIEEMIKGFDERWPSTRSYTAGKMQEDIRQMLYEVHSHAYRQAENDICSFIRKELAGKSYADAKYVADDIEHHSFLTQEEKSLPTK